MMAKRMGKVAELHVAEISETPDWKKVRHVVDATWNANWTEVDMSDQDSLNNEYLRGRGDFSIDGTLRYNPQDEGQALLEESAFEQTTEANILVRWRSKAGAGEKEFVAPAFVSAFSNSRPDEAPQDISFTIRIAGPIERQDQNGGGGS